MGISVSKNTVESLVENTQSIISNYENICVATGNTAQAQVNLDNCKLTNGTRINVQSTQQINQTCISSNTTRDNMTNDVRQSMQQSAQAITQSFGLPSLSLSESFIKESVKLGENIVNNYYNKCITAASASKADFTCQNSNLSGAVINIESYQKLSQQCTQNNISDNNLTSSLVTTLSQSDVAKQQDTFAVFAAIFIVLILVFAYAGISLADNPLVEWGIVILVAISVITSVVYSISAKKNGHYPYNKNN